MKALTLYKEIMDNKGNADLVEIGYKVGTTIHLNKQILKEKGFDFIEKEVLKYKYELKEDGTKYDYYLPLENGVYRPDLDKQNEQEQITLHEQKSNEVDSYVNSLVITTASGKLFKANYSALTSMDIILKGDYPDGTIPIWKQNIEGQLVYYEDVPLSELSEVKVEANKRIQAKHAEVFLNRPNPYND